MGHSKELHPVQRVNLAPFRIRMRQINLHNCVCSSHIQGAERNGIHNQAGRTVTEDEGRSVEYGEVSVEVGEKGLEAVVQKD